MNTTRTLVTVVIAIAAAAANVAAHAEGASYDHPQAVSSSSLSRAAVQADTQLARSAGLIVVGEQTAVAALPPSMLSRAQVRAEAVAARDLGLIARGEETVFASAEQWEQVRLAGARAAAMTVAAR